MNFASLVCARAWLLFGALCLVGASPLVPGEGFADPLPVTTLPGERPSNFTRMYQREADEAFQEGDFERAHDLYLKKLARKGDKYAHYMLGHLNEKGLGVPKDPSRALAWYVLAAERGAGAVKEIAQRLESKLTDSERHRADTLMVELEARYGDRRLLARALRRDERELRNRTGSRLGAGTSPMLVVAPDGTTISGDQYYQILEDRIAYRRELLDGTVSLGEFELLDAPEDEAPDAEEP